MKCFVLMAQNKISHHTIKLITRNNDHIDTNLVYFYLEIKIVLKNKYNVNSSNLCTTGDGTGLIQNLFTTLIETGLPTPYSRRDRTVCQLRRTRFKWLVLDQQNAFEQNLQTQ